jgi:hypothetical protein
MRHGGLVTKSFTATASSPSVTRTAPPPPVAAGAGFSGTPSPSYRQHYNVLEPRIDGAEFRPHWLVKTHAMALLEAKKIDRDQFAAALS